TSVSGPFSGAIGQSLAFTVGADDPDAGDNAAGFTFDINWGDGSPIQTVSGTAPTLTHTFVATGNVTVTATDAHGLVGSIATNPVTIGSMAIDNGTLYLGGTDGNDVFSFLPKPGGVQFSIGTAKPTFVPGVTRIVAYGLAGNDCFKLPGHMQQPV